MIRKDNDRYMILALAFFTAVIGAALTYLPILLTSMLFWLTWLYLFIRDIKNESETKKGEREIG